MNFDPSPESMGSREQIWFPSDYNRIRWWTKEGQYSIIRPPLGPDAAFALGLDRDVFWAQIGRLPAKLGNDLFAEWIVYRQDLGRAVTASKIEVAVDGYYERLLEDTMEPPTSTLKAAMGIDAAASVLDSFSSREPGFVILSDSGRAPVVSDMEESTLDLARSCDNIGPMKRSIFALKNAS